MSKRFHAGVVYHNGRPKITFSFELPSGVREVGEIVAPPTAETVCSAMDWAFKAGVERGRTIPKDEAS